MRIMIHSVPPWAPSGYGVQCALLARGLRDAGHDVTISAYGGFLREEPWEGIPLLSCGPTTKGIGLTWHNYRRAKAELMIVLTDLWVLDPREWDGMKVAAWMPVDTTPLGMADWLALETAKRSCDFTPIAMTQHAAAMLAERGHEAGAVIPHMLEDQYRPGDRTAWRKANNIPLDAFIISMVGVNGGYPERKCFTHALCAFQIFAERHPKARLYLHTVQRCQEGVDLLQAAKTLGLADKVGWVPQLQRLADEYGPDWMASMYAGSDVVSLASRGEGFGVPIIESLACGTPVVGARNSCIPELIPPEAGWLCDVQPEWNNMHAAFWHTPIIKDLARCYEKAYVGARLMRGAAAAQGDKYRPATVIPMWEEVLSRL